MRVLETLSDAVLARRARPVAMVPALAGAEARRGRRAPVRPASVAGPSRARRSLFQ